MMDFMNLCSNNYFEALARDFITFTVSLLRFLSPQYDIRKRCIHNISELIHTPTVFINIAHTQLASPNMLIFICIAIFFAY